MKGIALGALGLMGLGPIFAADPLSPVGLWKTFASASGKPIALVRISESGGRLTGRVEKLFRDPGQNPNPRCSRCDGAKRDQPIVGMEVLEQCRLDGRRGIGGRILDAEEGKTYDCRIEVVEEGKRMKVRGYIGLPIIGKTYYWERVE